MGFNNEIMWPDKLMHPPSEKKAFFAEFIESYWKNRAIFKVFFYSFAIWDQGDWSISNRDLFKYTEASPGKVLENESIF